MPLLYLKHKSLQAIKQTCIIIHIDRNQKAFTAQKTQTAKVSVKGILSRRQIVELTSLRFWKNSESTVLRQSPLSTKPTAKMHHLFLANEVCYHSAEFPLRHGEKEGCCLRSQKWEQLLAACWSTQWHWGSTTAQHRTQSLVLPPPSLRRTRVPSTLKLV